MKPHKSFFIAGIIAGTAAFISCLADMEAAQYTLGSLSLISFALSDRCKNANSIFHDL